MTIHETGVVVLAETTLVWSIRSLAADGMRGLTASRWTPPRRPRG